MKTVLCLLIALAAPCSFGAKDEKAAAAAADGVLLDENKFPCENCFFGMNDYYFCFQAGDKILIGHDKVRTQMRKKDPSAPLKMGAAMPLKYNDKYIWLTPSGMKEIRLTQDYKTQIFLNNARCKAVTR